MPLLSFKFSAEELSPEKAAAAGVDAWESNGSMVTPTESLLFPDMPGRAGWVTEARQHGIYWFPEIGHSVVNTFADTWACFFCGRCPGLGCTRPVVACGLSFYRMSWTRAQWLWSFNLICHLAHATMAYLCFTACNGTRLGVSINPNCTAEAMSVPIFRLTSKWENRTADGYSMGTVDNGAPVRFDLITGWFFLLSALFHGLWVVLGPFDRFAFLYWKQIDSAWAWWRGAEYSASAPLMFMGLQLIIGLREQNTIALSWICMVGTMVCGLATETWSRPAERDSDGYRGWKGDPERTNQIMAIERKRRTYRGRNYIQRDRTAPYPYDQRVATLSSQERYDFENQGNSAPMPETLTFEERAVLRKYAIDYTRNYMWRMIPHFIGWFPVRIAQS